MTGVVLLLTLSLAGLFALAAVSKLANRTAFGATLQDFGVPNELAPMFAILVPLAEMLVAGLLIAPGTVWWGGVGGLALLLLFTLAIAISLARGRRPSCQCFGQFQAKPVGASTLVRNAVLAACTGLLVWQVNDYPGPSLLRAANDLIMRPGAGVLVDAAVLVALFGQGWIALHLLRQHGRLLLMIDNLQWRLDAAGIPAPGPRNRAPAGLPVGAPGPSFAVPRLSGDTLSLDALRERGRPVLLVFFDVQCRSCHALLPDVARWDREEPSRLTVALVMQGSAEEVRVEIARHALGTVLVQQKREVMDAYHVHVTPSAVLVDPGGAIAAPLAMGAEAIVELVRRVAGVRPTPSPSAVATSNGRGSLRVVPSAPSALSIGEIVPPVRLRDLDGHDVEFAAFRGSKLLVLFWNPGCGFCQRILPEVRSWERAHVDGATHLLLISTGAETANRAMGLRSRIALDRAAGGHAAFGVTGTPSAILVDAEGRIASPTAVGAPAVLALIGADHEAPALESPR